MATYTITLSDAQDKALHAVSVSAQAWINNAVYARCHIAMEEIIAAEVQRKLDAGESITGSRDDIVMAAPIKLAAERQAEIEAQKG